MTSKLQFYLPRQRGQSGDLPRTIEDYWEWISRNRGLGEGKYSWTLQTYIHLAEAGVPCELTRTFPDAGIVVSHRDFLPVSMWPRPSVYLVCIKPDRKRHTWANFHVVQNAQDRFVASAGADSVAVITFWPQPSLKPRSPSRKALCERIAYFGRATNLADEIRSPMWAERLKSLGFDWLTPDLPDWNDYSQVDVTISIRGFDDEPAVADPLLAPDSKPPSKLINSWLAGVPAVVGRESAYQAIRKSPLDYLEAATVEEAVEAILRLRREPKLFQLMIENGYERAREYSVSGVSARWRDVVEEQISVAYEAWLELAWHRRALDDWQRTASYFLNAQNISDLFGIMSKRRA